MRKGTIVENSLRDKSILDTVLINRTWTSGSWTLHDVEIEEDAAFEIGTYLNDGPWYIHFWQPGQDDVLVVFKDRHFWTKHSDKATWSDAIEYGKALGIPEQQLDFVID